jgi:16S rRNA (cytosine967-C5)-methyltransferase
MKATGQLITIDHGEERQRRTKESMERLGHHGVQVVTADVLEVEMEPGDRVLIDVPCSGTGVAHRRADLAARRGPEDVPPLVLLQRALLDRAADLVKPGGVLVYSTCSLEPEENGRTAKAFEKRHGGRFVRFEAPESLWPEWLTGVGEAMTWPPRDDMDGSYSVRWQRIR